MTILLKNGTVLDYESKLQEKRDVLIEDNIIKELFIIV